MPPLDLGMNVYSRHFTDQSSVMGCGDLIQSVLGPPQQITGGAAKHHATSSFMGAIGPVQEQDRQLVLDLAATAADTLAKMCRAGEPLWLRRRGASSEVMVADEHARMFSWPVDGGQQGSASTGAAARTEGSRDSAVVIMNSITLVDAFLDAVSFQSFILHFNAQAPSAFPTTNFVRCVCVEKKAKGITWQFRFGKYDVSIHEIFFMHLSRINYL